MITICIDCGASFIKGARFEDGKLAETQRVAAPGISSYGNIFRPDKVIKLVGLVRKMFTSLTVGHEVSLCISNEMHGFILTDEQGIPYTDYISWQMEFGRLELGGHTSADLLQDRLDATVIQHSGMPVRAGLPSANLFYLSRIGALAKRRLYFYTLGDFIVKSLSEIEPVCHPTNAGATGLYDIFSCCWNRELIDYIGARDIVFPKVGGKVIDCEIEGIHTYCYPAVGDQQAALFGAGLIGEDGLSFNLGTGAQVSILLRSPEVRDGCQCRPYFSDCFLRTIPHIPSGRALNVFYGFIKSILEEYGVDIPEDVIWDGMIRSSRQGKRKGLDFDISFFENAVTKRTSGGIEGVTEDNFNMSDFFCALFEKLAENFVRMADIVVDDPAKIRSIIFSGGVARRCDNVRDVIVRHYPEASVFVSQDDTLCGLYKYSVSWQNVFESTL